MFSSARAARSCAPVNWVDLDLTIFGGCHGNLAYNASYGLFKASMVTEMLPAQLQHLTLIPAHAVTEEPELVPNDPGVYLFFVRGGTVILRASGYFRSGGGQPLEVDGRQHLYTGAADKLQRRMKQHFLRDHRSSSFRTSLHALERIHHALSRTGTAMCKVRDERTLSRWMSRNVTIAFEPHADPFNREKELLHFYPAPLNIALQSSQPYSQHLSACRERTFEKRLPRHWYRPLRPR